MKKFLFTDGTNGVREAQSEEELRQLIEATAVKDAVRIWLFSTSEWMSYADFCKTFPYFFKVKKVTQATNGVHIPDAGPTVKPRSRQRLAKKILLYTVIGTGIFLVYNFTRIKWEQAAPLQVQATRPANVPYMDVDSLIADIEFTRGQRIDKNTKFNLRTRNTWPEKILLQASGEHETSTSGDKYFNVTVSLDNATGLKLDKAVVRFVVWKNQKQSSRDTLQFGAIPYGQAIKRELPGTFRGDSISLAFESITARSFNFCYSIDKENHSGNYNDRWFCRE